MGVFDTKKANNLTLWIIPENMSCVDLVTIQLYIIIEKQAGLEIQYINLCKNSNILAAANYLQTCCFWTKKCKVICGYPIINNLYIVSLKKEKNPQICISYTCRRFTNGLFLHAGTYSRMLRIIWMQPLNKHDI